MSYDYETLDRVRRREIEPRPGILGAVIQDGVWKGYTLGEAMIMSSSGVLPLPSDQHKK